MVYIPVSAALSGCNAHILIASRACFRLRSRATCRVIPRILYRLFSKAGWSLCYICCTFLSISYNPNLNPGCTTLPPSRRREQPPVLTQSIRRKLRQKGSPIAFIGTRLLDDAGIDGPLVTSSNFPKRCRTIEPGAPAVMQHLLIGWNLIRQLSCYLQQPVGLFRQYCPNSLLRAVSRLV